MKQTVQTLQAMKERGEKIAMLTCYDYTTAKLMDEAGMDMLLVGDSLGNVILGYSDTISVTMEDMIHHTAAVSRGQRRQADERGQSWCCEAGGRQAGM